MRMLSKLLAASASALALTALVAGPAMADPPSTPRVQDIVGVGSDTTQFVLDQLSHNFNKGKTGATAKLYSWDAVPQGQTITGKAGGVGGDCTGVRPTGSSQGIGSSSPTPLSLESNSTVTGGTGFCTDFARSSRARASGDPACAANGICFVRMAGDAVTWASRAAGTNAPASLTLTQLKNIYLCKVRNWANVGGTSGTIKPFIPQTSSGTRSFFLTALGGGTTPITPGACVSDLPTSTETGGTLVENEGDAPQLNDVNAIFPYSVGDYLAQKYHSANCAAASCGYPAAPTCTPKQKENLFGCNLTGALKLNEIAGTKPALPWPLPAAPTPPAINNKVHTNTAFSTPFQRIVYNVVRFASTADHIPAYLEPIFGASGYACSAAGQTAIKDYGFLVLPTCGSAS
jgi:ABC-type phosphate transport system substrate-binding protein